MVVLLDAVHDALAGGEINHSPTRHRIGDGSALGGVLPFALDYQRGATEYVQLAFRVGLLVHLAHLGRGRDGVEDAALRDPRLRMVGDQLIAVRGNSYPGKTRLVSFCGTHTSTIRASLRTGLQYSVTGAYRDKLKRYCKESEVKNIYK